MGREKRSANSFWETPVCRYVILPMHWVMPTQVGLSAPFIGGEESAHADGADETIKSYNSEQVHFK